MSAPKDKNSIEEGVLKYIEEHRLLSPGQRVVVAVSGGADSVCLLHVLFKLRERLGITLRLAHLNHQLRGAEAEADARYVSELSRRLDIPATVEQRDVKAYQAQQQLSREEAAREVRYAFLAEVAGSTGADCVAVGHTLDDHVETVLMHLIRGSGPRGLSGLQPVSRWRSGQKSISIIRPLLQLSRQETEAYCLQNQLETRTDSSNLSLSPLRNRIRQRLLPLLGSYNPMIVEALQRTARIASDDIAFLEEELSRRRDEVMKRQGDAVILDKGAFSQLPLALQRYILRVAIEGLVDSVKDIEMRHIEAVIAALGKPAGRRLDLPLGLTFSIEYDHFLIARDPAVLSPLSVLDSALSLNVPGETRLPGWCVRAEITSPSAMTGSADNFRTYLDLDKAGKELLVRSRQLGDRFYPLGMSQPKKLSRFMIDEKIPRLWRQRVPLVCSPEGILWVVGWRIDDRVKVTSATGRVLSLEFKQA